MKKRQTREIYFFIILINNFSIALLTTNLALEAFWISSRYDGVALMTWDISHSTFVSLVESPLSSTVKAFSGKRKIVLVEVVEFLGDDSVVFCTCLAFTDSVYNISFCITYVIWEFCDGFFSVGSREIILPSPSLSEDFFFCFWEPLLCYGFIVA